MTSLPRALSVPASLAPHLRRLRETLSHPNLTPLWTLAALYLVHYTLIRSHLQLGVTAQVFRPLKALPMYLFHGWDGGYYVRMARELTEFAWPPLYPLVLRVVAFPFTAQAVEKAALLTNLGSHVAIAYGATALLRSHPRLAEIPAWAFLALLFFFPGHNVFFAVYSESLFLALTLWSAALWLRGRKLSAGVLAGLACLTRLLGVYFGAALLGAELWDLFRKRRWEWRALAKTGVWILFFAGWVLYVWYVGHTTLTQAQIPWQEELVRVHIPRGENPKGWVFRYLALSSNKEVFFFWAVVAAIVYAAIQRWTAFALYLLLFLASFALHLYRPFPFTRFVSVLFPVALAVAHGLRRWPRVQVVVVALCAIQSSLMEMLLFSDRAGEP